MDSTIANSRDAFRQSPAYESASRFLLGRIDFERIARMPYSHRDLNLSRMRDLLALLDSPHEKLRVIHVAGTKGKGSTTAFLSSVVAANALRCGTYTSPHLHGVEERFSVNGRCCTPERLVQLVDQVMPAVEQMDRQLPADTGPTFFEITTAIAFLYFLEEQVDVAVMEVGLGGRLDSTNVCHPALCVITSISYDHTKQLGSTLSSIAREKAGIIKPGIPVISGATHPEARTKIEQRAAAMQAPLSQLDVDFRYVDYRPHPLGSGVCATMDLQIRDAEQWRTLETEVPIGLHGQHQAANATLAWAALRTVRPEIPISSETLRHGLQAAVCPARVEIFGTRPCLIIDAAHNVASVEALVSAIETFPSAGKRWLILGATKGKDVAGMLHALLPAFDRVVCTRYQDNPRGTDIAELVAMAQDLGQQRNAPCANHIAIAANPAAAWRDVRQQAGEEDLICVTGSFFIAAEMRAQLD